MLILVRVTDKLGSIRISVLWIHFRLLFLFLSAADVIQCDYDNL